MSTPPEQDHAKPLVLQHDLKVEESYNPTNSYAVEFSHSYNALKQNVGVGPIPEYGFPTRYSRLCHRRHVVHGVSLSKRLLEGPLSKDDAVMLEKLLNWSIDDGCVTPCGC